MSDFEHKVCEIRDLYLDGAITAEEAMRRLVVYLEHYQPSWEVSHDAKL